MFVTAWSKAGRCPIVRMTVDPVWSHLRFHSCCFEHKVQTKYFPRQFTRTQDWAPMIFGCCCNLKGYWAESISHPFFKAHYLSVLDGLFHYLYSVKLNVSTVFYQWGCHMLQVWDTFSNGTQYLLSIQRGNKIHFIMGTSIFIRIQILFQNALCIH